MNPLLDYWYFHLPNFVLAALMYSLLGRLVMSSFAPAGWKNYIWRAFVQLTEPVLEVVRIITPSCVPEVILTVFAVLWIALLRLVFVIVLAGFDLLPKVT
jgi:uncharacterized protein YggT (Ycf19 family)